MAKNTIEIVKRDSSIVEFDESKIIVAVSKAMEEIDGKADEVCAEKIANKVRLKALKSQQLKKLLTVEEIQDIVELELMKEYPMVAKAYVLYRAKRTEERNKPMPSYKYLDEDFLKPYRSKKDSFTSEYGRIVYKRTYARPLPEEKRREDWWETVARVVDYSTDLEVIAMKKQGLVVTPSKMAELKETAKEMYKHMFNMGLFPSGRSLWVGGSEASYKYPLSNFNCFSRDTEFITNEGIKSFEDFNDGDKAVVLNANGAWSEATVKNFGVDKIVELKLRKGNMTKTIKTTDNHIWYVHKKTDKGKYLEKKTSELQIGDYFREKRRYEKRTPVPCKIGIQHGIVYGDGTYDKKKDFCSVSLVGEKQELLKYITSGSVVDINNGEQTRVYGLPNNWKEAPDVSKMNLEYLYGFLIGYFATDGSVTNNQHTISSSNKKDMELVRDICSLVGKSTGNINIIRETSPFDGSYAPLYGINILSSSITDEFLINSKHRKNSKLGGRELLWKLESMTYTGTQEPVWCVQEPVTNSFTLADDILTHNCSFIALDELKKFGEMFFVLMLGTGVGISVEREFVNKLPKINSDIEVIHKDYTPVPRNQRLEHTEITQPAYNVIQLNVADSKYGWSRAMELYLDIVSKQQYDDIDFILINYDNVRPAGEPLKTFGGFASGHGNLKAMFKKIDAIFKKMGKGWNFLKPIDVLDMATIIAENVVSGGVRRSALIIFTDPDEKEVIEAKSNLYKQDSQGNWTENKEILHRSLSNNTIKYYAKPNWQELSNHVNTMRYTGEPGFDNMENALKRREDAVGFNPCNEIILRDRGVCNLTEVNMAHYVDDNGNIDYNGLYTAQKLSALIGYRMATIELEIHEWNLVNQEDRLVGCSLTGMTDFMHKANMSYNDMIPVLNKLREVATNTANELADSLGMNRPKLVTTIKPSGTISQLPTVASGLHFNHSQYFIRRVRVSAQDPLAIALAEMGYNWSPEVGQTEDNHDTKVFEFPIQAPKGKYKGDVGAIEQLEWYKLLMNEYVDHNASITVHVKDDEWDDVAKWLYNNWDDVLGISFLPYDGGVYKLAPYETISKEVYENMLQEIPKFNNEILTKHERFGEEFDVLDSDCDSGLCPVR